MQDTDSPSKFLLPFGAFAAGPYINTIPKDSQVGIVNGAASLHDGFPPNTFISLSSGGAGPFGKDFNGLLKQVTGGVQWQQAGGPIYYDATFSDSIGGYPLGALLAAVGIAGQFWLSTVDNNSSDPDTGGGNWLALHMPVVSAVLGVPQGGTGDTTLLAHAPLIGNGTGPINAVTPSSASYPLISNGASADPTYQQLNLNVACTGKLPLGQSPMTLLYGTSVPGTVDFIVPANTFNLFGWCGAAGGGGAQNGTHTGGGGGGGGFAMGWFAVTPGQHIAMTVGAGGTGGTAGSDGGVGGSSSIGAAMSATGGAGGQSVANAAGGPGGIGSGPFFWKGGMGGDGSLDPTDTFAGNGGGSFFGGGSRASRAAYTPQAAIGSGGGGSYGPSPPPGSDGQPGAIFVWG